MDTIDIKYLHLYNCVPPNHGSLHELPAHPLGVGPHSPGSPPKTDPMHLRSTVVLSL